MVCNISSNKTSPESVARKFSNRYKMPGYYEDFLQEARIAAWHAETRFDATKGNLEHYKVSLMHGYVMTFVRKLRKFVEVGSQYDEEGAESKLEQHPSEADSQEVVFLEAEELDQLFESHIPKLAAQYFTGNRRVVAEDVLCRRSRGETLVQIGQAHGKTREWARRMLKTMGAEV